MTILFPAGDVLSAPSLNACAENAPRANCGGWSVGGYYSVSPDGYWFAGVSGGGEYFVLHDLGLGASISPGFGDGYFYDWPLRKGDSQSSGTFHGPGVSVLYGLTEELYSGVNVSYQWVEFAGAVSREWYFTVPAYWLF